MQAETGVPFPASGRASVAGPAVRKAHREKPQVSRKNKLVCFSACPAVFPCALCAQQGQLRWPARKRWTSLLFQLAFDAFTALREGFLLLF